MTTLNTVDYETKTALAALKWTLVSIQWNDIARDQGSSLGMFILAFWQWLKGQRAGKVMVMRHSNFTDNIIILPSRSSRRKGRVRCL